MQVTKAQVQPSSPLGACNEKYSKYLGEIKHSAIAIAIPTIIMKATG